MTIRRLPVFLVATALLVAGCGNKNDEKSAAAPTTAPTAAAATPTAATTPEPAAAPVSLKTLKPVENATDLDKEPIVPQQPGTAPAQLISKDLVKGTGPAAKSGDTLSVQYTGYSLSDGQKFDASWNRGAQPFDFQLGAQQVIAGWDQGIVGMKVGGRRELVIPSDLGYGPAGNPPIAPNETLIFVVDLVKIK
ncbi:MAG: hypothetical protein QOF76_129 [Solirubrobacteraceae bacterium]|jgi:FKBP-type peptidyl-prolyl cis-trans isomerase|nr:hypothetical protein [Solirubrobacteraceae bacterium]